MSKKNVNSKPRVITSDLVVKVLPFSGTEGKKGRQASLHIEGGKGHFTRHLREADNGWMGTLPPVKNAPPELALAIGAIQAQNPKAIILCKYVAE